MAASPATDFPLPGVNLAHAIPAPCPTMSSTGTCSEYWTPSGPEMDFLRPLIFINGGTEYTNLLSVSPSIDLTDFPDATAPVDCAPPSIYFTVLVTSGQYCYLSNWQRVVNDQTNGIPNYFTWLNAWSPNPESLIEATPTLTVRQGFYQSTTSLSPYVASSTNPQNFYILRDIFDSLFQPNPLSHGQLIEWMTVDPNGPTQFPCTAGVCPGIGYSQTCNATASNQPCIPSGTVTNYRFTLRGDLFWQDANLHPSSGFVSAWDVKFSYATLRANGAPQSAGLAAMSCSVLGSCVDGITVLGPRQFDFHLTTSAASTLSDITSETVFPGRLWSSCTSAQWDAGVVAGFVSDICMSANPTKLMLSFDPLNAGILIGSGAWQCSNVNNFTPAGFTSPPTIGTGCTQAGGGAFNFQNPPVGGTYTLQRFGYGTGAPNSAIPNLVYFRSSGNLAKWIWTNDAGSSLHDSANLAVVLACQNAPLTNLDGVPNPGLGFPNGCAHWQQGIGTGGATTPAGTGGCPAGATPCGIRVGPAQIVQALIYLGVRWVAPFDYTVTFGIAPLGIMPFPPVLYEGSYVSGITTIRPVLNPAVGPGGVGGVGCMNTYDPTSPTSGGYDC